MKKIRIIQGYYVHITPPQRDVLVTDIQMYEIFDEAVEAALKMLKKQYKKNGLKLSEKEETHSQDLYDDRQTHITFNGETIWFIIGDIFTKE